MLRAAYFAQELLSTFSTSLGEVALQPSTGGVFTIEILYLSTPSHIADAEEPHLLSKILWDRKTENGFPEVKELKRRVRDVIDPNKDLGHNEKGRKKSAGTTAVRESDSLAKSSAAPGRGGAEEELEAHGRRSLEVQTGGNRHGAETPVTGGDEEIKLGKIWGKGDGVERDADGRVCEDCV